MSNLTARDEELNLLRTTLKKSIKGKQQIVFVTGEAGIGKTSLVLEFIGQMKGEIPELFIARSKCETIAEGKQEPYLPFLQILDAISAEKKGHGTWERLREMIAQVGPDWIALVPGAGGLVAAVWRTVQWRQSEFDQQGPETEINRRLIQYTKIIQLASEAAPLLLWIDDLHWSDNATLDLISFLSDHAQNSRVMLIATYRPTDIADDVAGRPHLVKELVNKLQRYKQCIEIPLSNFSQDEISDFLEDRNHQFPAAFTARIWQQSGGNPLFVREYLGLLHDRRLLKRERGNYVLTQKEIEVEIPATTQAVIEQRLSLVEKDLRRLLSYASVQGERFASKVLAQLSATKELDVLEKLNMLRRTYKLVRELEERRLIVKVGSEYQFIHVLIQQVLYSNLSAGERRQLHLSIAQLLEDLYDDQAEQYSTDLAVHFEQGGNFQRAIHYYLQGSRKALAILALDDSLTYAETAQRLARQMGEVRQNIAWRIEALIVIMQVHYLNANSDGVIKTYDEGEKLCREWDFPEHRANLLYWYSVFQRDILTTPTVEPARQALEILGDQPENYRLRGYLYAHLGSLGTLNGLINRSETEDALDNALGIAEKYKLSGLLAETLIQKTRVPMKFTDKPEEALPIAESALVIAQENKMLDRQIICHRLLAYVLGRLKRGEEAFLHSQQAVELAKNAGLPRALHIAYHSLALSWYGARENLVEALKAVQEGVAVAEQHKFPINLALMRNWFNVAFGLGRWEDTERVQTLMHNRISPTYPRVSGYYFRQQGYLAYCFGNFEESLKNFIEASTYFSKSSGDKRYLRISQIETGMALVAKGDLARGAEILTESYRYWKDKNVYWAAQSLRGLAQVDLAKDIVGKGVARLREAFDLVNEYKSGSSEEIWPVQIHIYTDLGNGLFRSGEFDEALEYALTGYEKIKNMSHFLAGEAAFVVGKILVGQGKEEEARPYLLEARDDWKSLGLTNNLTEWDGYMRLRKIK